MPFEPALKRNPRKVEQSLNECLHVHVKDTFGAD